MTDEQPRVPLKQLAHLTGLSPILIRAWERRYRFPSAPHRTAGGHRRYTPAEVEMVRQAALLVRAGLRASDAIDRARAGRPLPPQVLAASASELAELLVEADPARALEELRRSTVSSGFESTLEAMVVPALHEVGQGWSKGRFSVAEEHVATGVVMSWLGSVRADLPEIEAPPVYVVANPEGEEHAVAVWALEVLLRMRQVPVRALGASVPVADLQAEARRPGLRGMVLSVSRRQLRPRVARIAAALAQLPGGGPHLYVGGAGAAPAVPGATLLGGTLTESADRLRADLEAAS